MLPMLCKNKLVVFAFVAGAPVLGLTSTANAQCEPFINQYSGQCMAVTGGTLVSGTPIIEWPCIGSRDQYWEIDPDENFDGGYFIRNCGDAQQCLAATQSTTDEGSQLLLEDCNTREIPAIYPIWELSSVSYSDFDALVLTNRFTRWVAAVSLGPNTGNPPGTEEGTGIIQWLNQTNLTRGVHTEQQWVF